MHISYSYVQVRYDHITNITEVDLFVFDCRLFHDDFSPILRTNFRSEDRREIFMKQSVNKYR